MPESTCLHIQDRESGPIRVVELPGISVRIGRAAYCEVQLPDARVEDEVCRLTRKGKTWNLIPATGEGPILLEGQRVSGPCQLPFDVPFRLGPYCLTLRHDLAAEPDWEIYPASEPPAALDSPRATHPTPSPSGETERVCEMPSSATGWGRSEVAWGVSPRERAADSTNLLRATAQGFAPGDGGEEESAERVPLADVLGLTPPVTSDRPSGASQTASPAEVAGRSASGVQSSEKTGRPGADPDRWRARWKAAEAHLKARANRLDTGGRAAPYTTQPDSVPGTAWSPHDLPATTPSPAGLSPRPAPAPSTPLIEPAWSAPRPDPSPPTPRIDPIVRPTHVPPVSRFEPSPPRSFEAPSVPPAAVLPRPAEVVEEEVSQRPLSTGERTSASGMDITDAYVAASVTGAYSEHAPTEADQRPIPEPTWDEPSRYDVGAIIDESWPSDLSQDVSGDDREAIESSPRPEPEIPSSEYGLIPDRPKARYPSGDASGARRRRGPSAFEEEIGDPSRPIDRRPRKRKPPRERAGGGRRSDSLRRPRQQEEPSDSLEVPEIGAATSIPEVELPSVRDILATHRNGSGPPPAVDRPRKGQQPMPTVPQEPGQWVVPAWLALPPVGAFALAAGLVACVLSWWWARDASNASAITHRLLAAAGSGRPRPLPQDFTPPGGRWIKSTAQHMAHWGIYLAREAKDEQPLAGEAPSLLTQALEISPLNPTARLAMAQLEPSGRDGTGRIRGLGLSRDSVSLAWSARRLMDSGKKEAALRLYGRALAAAADGGLSRTATPRFSDDPAVLRYFLPAEDAVRDIVAVLASREGLEFREWSRALPRNPVVLLATARLLHEQGRTEAEGLLDELLADGGTGPVEGHVDPRLLAARAEALTLRSRWPEAAEQYRQAIERVDNDLVRRSWWFNLADIAQRLNDEGQRQTAIRAALAVASSDDITRRASLIQKSSDTRARPRYGYGSIRAQ